MDCGKWDTCDIGGAGLSVGTLLFLGLMFFLYVVLPSMGGGHKSADDAEAKAIAEADSRAQVQARVSAARAKMSAEEREAFDRDIAEGMASAHARALADMTPSEREAYENAVAANKAREALAQTVVPERTNPDSKSDWPGYGKPPD